MIKALLATLLLCISMPALAQITVQIRSDLSPGQQELAGIIKQIRDAESAFNAQLEAISDDEERFVVYRANDPYAPFMAQLLEFEARHHGSDLGFLAARQIVNLAAGGGLDRNSRFKARRSIAEILPDYADHALLYYLVRYLGSGQSDLTMEVAYQSLLASPKITDANREAVILGFARYLIDMRDIREVITNRLADLEAGDSPRHFGERERLQETLDAGLPGDRVDTIGGEVEALLEDLVQSETGASLPQTIALDEEWILLECDSNATGRMETYSESAQKLLFRERHLKPGRMAPALQANLVGGQPWSLQDQRGKVTVVHFMQSDEADRPDAIHDYLHQIRDRHGDEVTILSIMSDDELQTTMDAVAARSIPWPVVWDGGNHPITSQWVSYGVPTACVIDADGRVAGFRHLGFGLKRLVDELVD